MSPFKDLEVGGKAVEQLDAGLKKGPIIRIISILSVALLVSVIFNIRFLIESRERELDLMERVVEEVRRTAPGLIRDEVAPIKQQVNQTIIKMDSTIIRTDSLLIKADSLIR